MEENKTFENVLLFIKHTSL